MIELAVPPTPAPSVGFLPRPRRFHTGGFLTNFEFQRRLRLAEHEAINLETAALDELPHYVCPLCGLHAERIEEKCRKCGQLFDVHDGQLVVVVPRSPQNNRKGHRL